MNDEILKKIDEFEPEVVPVPEPIMGKLSEIETLIAKVAPDPRMHGRAEALKEDLRRIIDEDTTDIIIKWLTFWLPWWLRIPAGKALDYVLPEKLNSILERLIDRKAGV